MDDSGQRSFVPSGDVRPAACRTLLSNTFVLSCARFLLSIEVDELSSKTLLGQAMLILNLVLDLQCKVWWFQLPASISKVGHVSGDVDGSRGDREQYLSNGVSRLLDCFTRIAS